jgi:hypothetical protein
VVLVATATVIAVSGGFRTTVGGFRVSMRSPLAASIAAFASGAWWWYLARRQRSAAADLEWLWLAIERHSSRLIGALALVAALVASTFATRSAAGADASGYLSQAAMWASAATIHADPLGATLTNPDGWLTSPLGWRPGTTRGAQSPTYPPGLPLLMAAPQAVAGIHGAVAIVIASAALAVWATGMIAGGAAGLIAAMLLAFSPAFLYQSFQPMSDVPVTAAWMLTFLLAGHPRRSMWAGIACAAAVLIRPNLAPLAAFPFLISARKVPFAIPVAIAAAFLAAVQTLWYGSPLQTGYGSADELFAWSNIGPNASRYLNWLVATAPVLIFAPFGLTRVRAGAYSRALAAFAVLVCAAYLVYAVFDHWSYLRFLLPALAVMAIFSAIELTAWIGRWPASWRAPIFVALLLAVAAHGLFVARSLDVFKLADQLHRVVQVADFVSRSTPREAVILSGEQSGALRYYTGRPILRWEAATPDTLRAGIAALENAGRPVYVALDAWENEPFRNKFSTVAELALDWPPMLEAGTSHRTRLWRLADRARFAAGENLTTIRLP